MSPTGDDVFLVGMGMVTSVGLSAAETAASVRAGIMRFLNTRWLDDAGEPFRMALVPDDGLDPLRDPPEGVAPPGPRVARLLRLGAVALRECLAPLGAHRQPLGLILALPEVEPRGPIDGPAFLKGLKRQSQTLLDSGSSTAEHRGRAGGVAAIGQAVRRLRGGEAGVVVAGGVDTFHDFWVLDWLDAEYRIKSSTNFDSFIPGEGAGFVCLATSAAARSLKLEPLARLSAAAEGFEEGYLWSEKPYRGDGLAEAFRRFFESDPLHEPIREVYSSMNGENYWAREWGVAFLRNQEFFDPEHGMHHPADCFGDLGAACGATFVGLAATGIRQGYRRGPSLVYGSSDRGARALIAVSALGRS